jgi:hypothetical protein
MTTFIHLSSNLPGCLEIFYDPKFPEFFGSRLFKIIRWLLLEVFSVQV